MADVVMKIDDLDETPIAEGEGGRVVFAFEGKSYAIDLTNAHRDELAALLTPYISKATEVDSAEAAQEASSALPLVDQEEAKRLAVEELEQEKAAALRAEAQRRVAAGELPYEISEARQWLDERGIAYNQMGPLKEEFRVIYEQHFGLPSYIETKRAQKKGR